MKSQLTVDPVRVRMCKIKAFTVHHCGVLSGNVPHRLQVFGHLAVVFWEVLEGAPFLEGACHWACLDLKALLDLQCPLLLVSAGRCERSAFFSGRLTMPPTMTDSDPLEPGTINFFL